MKKALILGTNAGQADIIDYLIDKGWEVHACGHEETGPGCKLSHKFHLVDTLDYSAVANLAKMLNVNIVYSVSSDSAIRTATRVAENLNLPVLLNSEIIDLFHYKEQLRAFLNKKDISKVACKVLTSIEQTKDWHTFPCVVKPSDSQGQRGVRLVNEMKDLHDAVSQALKYSKTKTVIIEEFLDGVEFSTNMIVQQGKILVNEFTERLVFGSEYFGLPEGHSIPARNINPETLKEAGKLVTQLVNALNIADAVLYIQMKATKQGPKIIEVAPRLDGCHIWRLIKLAKGYDLRQYAIDCLTRVKMPDVVSDSLPEKLTLKFHHLPTGSKFSSKKLTLPKDYLYNEFRYKEKETIQPINGRLEVVGYYIYKG